MNFLTTLLTLLNLMATHAQPVTQPVVFSPPPPPVVRLEFPKTAATPTPTHTTSLTVGNPTCPTEDVEQININGANFAQCYQAPDQTATYVWECIIYNSDGTTTITPLPNETPSSTYCGLNNEGSPGHVIQ